MQIETTKSVRLDKVTLNYVPLEDRIRMTGQTEAKQAFEFWLTLRLCKRLIAHMVNELSNSGLQVTEARNTPAVQQFMQRSATARKKPAKPVSLEPTESFTPQKIQIRSNKQGIFLRIPMTDSEVALLALSRDETRQWLNILYQQFVRADWPLDVWPEWFASGDAETEPQARPSFH